MKYRLREKLKQFIITKRLCQIIKKRQRLGQVHQNTISEDHGAIDHIVQNRVALLLVSQQWKRRFLASKKVTAILGLQKRDVSTTIVQKWMILFCKPIPTPGWNLPQIIRWPKSIDNSPQKTILSTTWVCMVESSLRGNSTAARIRPDRMLAMTDQEAGKTVNQKP